MTILQILWFFLIFVLIAGYFVLDGFDLGAGVLYPVLAKDETERAYIRRSIGPVWDGNEVWLLTAGCVVRGVSRGIRHDVLGLLPRGDARALRPYRARRLARIPRP